MALVELDRVVVDLASKLYSTFATQPWERLRYAARWTPTGDVGADDFWLLLGEQAVKTLPDLQSSLRISDAAKHHWQLTQDLGLPRWYKMTVTVERSGKFSVEFEYKDDYKEGDIMQRG